MIKHQIDEMDQKIGLHSSNPAVTIILPFEPKMIDRPALDIQLRHALLSVTKNITENYSLDIAEIMDEKIRQLFSTLNYNTYKKSVAIYVSPIFDKIIYLDIPVEEKIIINDSFEIRDLVYARKELHKYIVLVISGRCNKLYIGNTNTFIRIKSNVPDNSTSVINEIPERASNLSDPPERKEILLQKFLHQVDEGLSIILNAYPLPVFILGLPKVTGYYHAITKNGAAVIDYIPGNFEDASEQLLKLAITPFVADWRKLKLTGLLQELENAAASGRLSTGINDVHKESALHNGRKLIVEKNFMHAAAKEAAPDQDANNISRAAFIHDLVDDLIEKTLSDGGDVEFVDEGCLDKYGHIALILYN